MENYIEKDVCKFYGISHELYIERVCGIGKTSDFKKFGIEIEVSKPNNAGAKRYRKEKENEK